VTYVKKMFAPVLTDPEPPARNALSMTLRCVPHAISGTTYLEMFVLKTFALAKMVPGLTTPIVTPMETNFA
jgi:hypothetical protein